MNHAKQFILNTLGQYGPLSFTQIRAWQVDLDNPEIRPTETRAEIRHLLEEGLIEEIGDNCYRAKRPSTDSYDRKRPH